MIGVLLAKGIADLSFGGALLWYVVKYIVSAALAVAAVMLGIRLRKNKNAKTEQLAVDKESSWKLRKNIRSKKCLVWMEL